MKPDRVQRWPWIDRDIAQQLKVYCSARRVTETSVFNAALRDYLAEAKDMTLIMRRLDRNDRALAVVRQAVEMLSETFVAFLVAHFTNTHELPEQQRKLGATSARRRLGEVLDEAARRFAGGERLIDLLPKDVLGEVGDLDRPGGDDRDAGGSRS